MTGRIYATYHNLRCQRCSTNIGHHRCREMNERKNGDEWGGTVGNASKYRQSPESELTEEGLVISRLNWVGHYVNFQGGWKDSMEAQSRTLTAAVE